MVCTRCKAPMKWLDRVGKHYQPIFGFVEEYVEKGKIKRERVDGFKKILGTILGHCGDVGGKSFLDVGSNLGYFCLELANRGASVIGVERDGRRTGVAKCLAEHARLDEAAFHGGDVLAFIEDNDDRYDYVILLNVFHHILLQDEERGWVMFNKLLASSNGVFVMMRNSLKSWKLCDNKAQIPLAVLEASDATGFVAYPAVHGRVIYFFYKQP